MRRIPAGGVFGSRTTPFYPNAHISLALLLFIVPHAMAEAVCRFAVSLLSRMHTLV